MSAAIPNLWKDQACAGFSEPELLRHRSNLLGSDLRITNFGGGNTSAKVAMPDPLTGDDTTVLWVKGSGGDLGSMELDGFATLYLDKLLGLERLYRGRAHEDAMVGCLPHCTFDLNPRAASIDTPLHAFLPPAHIDHLHPDGVIAVAAARTSEELTEEIFGGEIGWVPWQRPGFDLGLRLRAAYEARPGLVGFVLAGHGLITWGATAKECYETSLRVINRAQSWLDDLGRTALLPFGAAIGREMPAREREALLVRLLPLLRGKVSRERRKVGHFATSREIQEFVNSERLPELASLGTSCPDHFLRTKIRPLVVEAAGRSATDVAVDLDPLLAKYRADYAAYYERCRHADSPALRDPYPVVFLLPGVGMVTFANDKPMARQAGEFYLNAIHVMRGANLLDEYVGLPEQEAFDIEYWQLEEAKLRRMPPERSLSRRVALVTGAAGGIGRASARRLLQEKACVVLSDVDGEGLARVADELGREFGTDFVRSIVCDVTDEAAVVASAAHAVLEYGGIDLLVCSAGLASASPVDELSLADWQRNLDVLTTGYFLAAREAFKVMKAQGTGGSIVFIASKNALAASPQAAAYCTAKAAVLHLARCLALEGAEHGIRVNSVNPDAVLRGSRIWSGTWREQRAAAYGVAEDELEDYYRKRSMLKLGVYPEDVAEAVWFFASDASGKSTGNILNVDAGNATSFPR